MTSLRLAVLPGKLIASRNWPDLRAVLGVATGASPAAAAADLLSPMIEALGAVEGGDGPIVQAMAFTLGDVIVAQDLMELLFRPRPRLDFYPLVLFADIAAGRDQINVIALPFANRVLAEMAVTVIAGRLAEWQPGAFKQPVLDVIAGRLLTAVVNDPRVAPAIAGTYRGLALAALGENAPDGAAAEPIVEIPDAPPGGAVALVVIRYPLPTGSGLRPSAFLSIALQAIYNREFAPLAVP